MCNHFCADSFREFKIFAPKTFQMSINSPRHHFANSSFTKVTLSYFNVLRHALKWKLFSRFIESVKIGGNFCYNLNIDLSSNEKSRVDSIRNVFA